MPRSGEIPTSRRPVTRQEIHAEIPARGLDDRGVLRQHYDTDALDASTLLAALFGFLPGYDERLQSTAMAIADELTEADWSCATEQRKPMMASPERRALS